ncbi:RNA-binding S4 domain-containing protein [Paludisphaera mucosa]|uniref:RNA-binding S4 domain-containing protein n=1 Tax=Paludisphaera mucosa TaxID=3030827 RepID=A0ABT6FB76_9BACT|nr:RNA-binding S4 domain-containing protein [Paludisphaera mucosa]MDG3004787.1 RNA-binding S4 domain-containing protein [Paludisphaera mucosa]
MSEGERQEIRLDVGDREINLIQVLKRAGCVMTGGEAKNLVAEGLIRVNGEQELRKRRQMARGDVVEIDVEDGPRIILD